MKGRFVRLAEQGRPTVNLKVDGAPIEALQGDTLMVALLTQGSALRQSEFDPGGAPVLFDGRLPGLLGLDPQRRTPACLFQRSP